MTNSLSVEFAGLGGTTRYLRYLGQTSYYIPAFWSAVFSAHATLGHIQALGKDIPIDEKFYLGGISTRDVELAVRLEALAAPWLGS